MSPQPDADSAESIQAAALSLTKGEPPCPELLACLRLVAEAVRLTDLDFKESPRRSEARQTLSEVQEAALRLASLLARPEITDFNGELTADCGEPGSGVPAVDGDGLRVLAQRAKKLRASIPAAGGATTLSDQRGKPRPTELAAVAIVELWRALHGDPAGANNEAAQDACASVWTAAGLPERTGWADQIAAVRMQRIGRIADAAGKGATPNMSRVLGARFVVKRCMREANLVGRSDHE